MAGFSNSIKRLADPTKWIDQERKSIVKRQTGAGKLTKKRHSVVDVKKCSKSSKKQKTRRSAQMT